MANAVTHLIRLSAIAAVMALPACAELERLDKGEPTAPIAKINTAPPAADGAAKDTPKIKGLAAEDTKVKGLRHVLQGSGRFLNQAPRRAIALRGRNGGITLNFVNAEIAEVVRAVLGGILNVNFVVDSGVRGSITLQTSRPIPKDGVLAALESALNVGGAALVRGDGIYRIVPRAKAPSQGAPTTIAGTRGIPLAGFATRIVPLRFVSALEMEKILKPLAHKGTIVRVDTTRNLLIMAAPAPELRALEDMVAVFDVDWLAGMSLAMVPLDFVNPEVLVKEIEQVLGKDKDSPLAGVLRFVPMARLNAVLVVSTQPAYLRRAEEIIAKLDQGGSGTERQLFVYRVQNSDAGQLADTLGQLFGAKGKTGSDLKGALAPQLTPGRATITTGQQTAANTQTSQTQTTAQQGATANPPRRSTGSSRSTRASAGGASGFTIDGSDQIRVVADKTNNAILVWATPVDYRMVVSVLRKLDQVPLQVLIEATIAEVTLTDSLRYGVKWFLRSGDSSATLTTAESGAVASTFPGFSYFLDSKNIKAVLDALETVTDLNVISSPQLMVLDNQTAELQVGDQVPVVTQQQQSTEDTTAPIINSVEYRDTGIILRVTPRVNSGGLVTMTIEQEASLVSDELTTEGIESPTFRQRRITSTVAVQSGDTVVLGGLIQDSRDSTESGVPLLRSVPGLGFFFGGKERENRRTELLVLITPRAVRSQREVRRVTEEMRKRLRAVVPLDMKIR